MPALFFALFLLVQNARAVEAPPDIVAHAREMRLWEKDEWHRLVHYRHHLTGWSSEARGANFFVAKDGRNNPQAELEATLNGFFSTEKRTLEGQNQPAQTVFCQFPARFDFLNRELHLAPPQQECKEWTEYRDRVAAKSVTIVFSSFYPGNPSTIYGHSLLRLNKVEGAKASDHQQLLDIGVNYAANQTTSNPVLYSLFGLFGLFKGTFTNMPYYYKVREYGDFESRDLWEYDLNLSPEEVARTVQHLWELGTTDFDYYYLNANCSYQLLTLIEAAAPRTHLVNRVPWWVIPTDSVKAFFDDGLVRKTNFRASLYSQFAARAARLDPAEKQELEKLVREDQAAAKPTTSLPSGPSESRARVADAYMDYVDLHYARQIYQKDETYTAPKDALLLARSKLPMTAPLDFSKAPPVSPPNESHPSARVMLSHAENQNFGGTDYAAIRFALHDLIDPPKGLPDSADIDFFELELRSWEKTKSPKFENATLFGVGTYPPRDPFLNKSSWRARIFGQRIDDPRCENCDAGGAEAGYGTSIGGWHALAYALADGEALTSPDFVESKFSLRLGPTLGVRLRASEELAWLTEASYMWALTKPQFDDYKIDSRLRWVPGNSTWGLEARGLYRTENREVSVALLHYF